MDHHFYCQLTMKLASASCMLYCYYLDSINTVFPCRAAESCNSLASLADRKHYSYSSSQQCKKAGKNTETIVAMQRSHRNLDVRDFVSYIVS